MPLRQACVLFRLVTHGFDVVPVGVEDIRREIVGVMFGAELWRAVIVTAGSQGRSVERLHLCPRRRTESDMDRWLDRRTLDDKELLILTSETDAARLCRPPRKFWRSGAENRWHRRGRFSLTQVLNLWTVSTCSAGDGTTQNARRFAAR